MPLTQGKKRIHVYYGGNCIAQADPVFLWSRLYPTSLLWQKDARCTVFECPIRPTFTYGFVPLESGGSPCIRRMSGNVRLYFTRSD